MAQENVKIVSVAFINGRGGRSGSLSLSTPTISKEIVLSRMRWSSPGYLASDVYKIISWTDHWHNISYACAKQLYRKATHCKTNRCLLKRLFLFVLQVSALPASQLSSPPQNVLGTCMPFTSPSKNWQKLHLPATADEEMKLYWIFSQLPLQHVLRGVRDSFNEVFQPARMQKHKEKGLFYPKP